MTEQIADAAALSQIAPVFAEGQANVSGRAVAVVGEGIHQHCHATGGIALIADCFQLIGPISPLARAFGNGAFDVGGGHSGGFGFGDGSPQLKIAGWIAPGASRHRDLATNAGEHSPALGIDHRFGAFDLGPFAVAGHRVVCARELQGRVPAMIQTRL